MLREELAEAGASAGRTCRIAPGSARRRLHFS